MMKLVGVTFHMATGALRGLGRVARNRGHEFVIGGYIPNSHMLDSLLVGYYHGREFMCAVQAGILWEFRHVLLAQFEGAAHTALPVRESPGSRRRGRGSHDRQTRGMRFVSQVLEMLNQHEVYLHRFLAPTLVVELLGIVL
jgi:hypothetical protein